MRVTYAAILLVVTLAILASLEAYQQINLDLAASKNDGIVNCIYNTCTVMYDGGTMQYLQTRGDGQIRQQVSVFTGAEPRIYQVFPDGHVSMGGRSVPSLPGYVETIRHRGEVAVSAHLVGARKVQ